MIRATHLCVQSHYSFRHGIDAPRALAEAAAARGIEALALTDDNGLYGAVDFYHAALAAGIKPILGARLTAHRRDPGCVVLARDFAGYQALCRLLTRYRLGEGDWAAVAREAAPHLIFLAGSRAWVDRLDGEALRAARSLYVRRTPADLCRGRAERAERERLGRYARARGLPVAASGEVAFVDPEAHEAHRVLAAMHAGTTLARLDPADHAPATAWLRDAERLRVVYANDREALVNACRIAAGCADRVLDPALGELRYPPLPPETGDDPDGALDRACRRGLEWRYGAARSPAAERRLRRELEVIARMGYASYFLVAHDIVGRARDRGVPVLGRGSAAGSLVSYVLGLTAVDPLAHGLSFERFLSLERASPPDIDLDFPWDDREAVVDDVLARYGGERVAMVGAFTTYEARGLVQEIGAALGLARPELAALSKRLPRVPLRDLPRALADHPTGLRLRPDREPLATMLRAGRFLDGVPKGLSMHPCGLVLAPDRVADWVPVERSAQGRRTTQYAMDPVEEVGLIKLDLIGNRALGTLRDAGEAVRAGRGRCVDFDAFDPAADAAAQDLMAEGRTLGCFYVESPSSRQVLQRLDCRDFETAVAATSIIRPGVSHAGVLEQYVARHRGEEEVACPHPALQGPLTDTYGVLIYQEQLLEIMGAFAGIPPGEADLVRRSLTKKGSKWRSLESFRDRFVQGARARGHDEAAIGRVWRQIESFAGYSFCKSHSAAFIVAAWQGAYLKAHYPAEFMAALLANGGGFYSMQAYLSEARRLGLTVAAPHVNASGLSPAAESGPDGAPGRGIRLGLDQLKGLRRETAEALVAERTARGPYRGPGELAWRVPGLDRSELECLVAAGALDGLGASRRALLWELEETPRGGRPANGTGDLFGTGIMDSGSPTAPVPPEEPRERLRWELRHMGAAVSDHPLALFTERLAPWRGRTVPATEVAGHVGRRIRVTGWHVTSKLARTRTEGRPMAFLTLEDESGLTECVLFPEAYRIYGGLLHEFGPLVAEGAVRRDQGFATLEVDRLILVGEEEGGERAGQGSGRDRVARGGHPPRAPTPPDVRVRIRRFMVSTQVSDVPQGSSGDPGGVTSGSAQLGSCGWPPRSTTAPDR